MIQAKSEQGRQLIKIRNFKALFEKEEEQFPETTEVAQQPKNPS